MTMLVKAAIKRGDKIITGTRHAECIYQAVRQHNWDIPITQDEQGFVDDDGNYYSRKDAMAVALKHGQIHESLKDSVLLSELLW